MFSNMLVKFERLDDFHSQFAACDFVDWGSMVSVWNEEYREYHRVERLNKL